MMLSDAIDTRGGGTIPQLKEELENLKFQAVTSVDIPVDRIIPLQLPRDMKQPRLYFDPQKMELLKDSIRKHGVLEPILLRPNQQEEFEIISGERRWRCCQTLGMMFIPAIVRKMSDSIALEAAMIAHLLNEEISSIEQTESILGLLSLRLNLSSEELRSMLYQAKNSWSRGTNNHRTLSGKQMEVVNEILDEFGMKLSSFVSNRLPLLNLAPAILDSVRSGKLSPTNAVIINRQPQELHDSLITQSIGKTKTELIDLIKSRAGPLPAQPKQKDMSDLIYQRIKSIRKNTALLDHPEAVSRLEKIDLLLKEIESIKG